MTISIAMFGVYRDLRGIIVIYTNSLQLFISFLLLQQVCSWSMKNSS